MNKGNQNSQIIFLVLVTLFLAPAATEAQASNGTNITFTLFATDMSGCDPNSDCDLWVNIMCSNVVTDTWEKCGETSKRQDDNNPVWPEVITLEHIPGIEQWWKFELIDEDFMFDDFIGAVEVVVDDYASKSGNLQSFPVPDNTGTFWIHRSR